MKCTLFVFLSSLAGCQSLGGGPELGITTPTIVEARFQDAAGKPTTKVELPEKGAMTGATVHVVATGFSPVKGVWLDSVDGKRVYELPAKTDKIYELPIDDLVTARALGDKDATTLSFRVVAVNIDGGEQVSKPITLTVTRAAHH